MALAMSPSSSSFQHLVQNSSRSSHFQSDTADSTTPSISAFDQTTQNLLKLGSLPLNKFAQDPSEEVEGFDIPISDSFDHGATSGDITAARAIGKEEESDVIPSVPPNEAVRFLRDTAQKELGATRTDPMKYEYMEDRNKKACILTIVRPNGLSRSYRTKAEFPSKSEAKIAVATSAIQLGAIHFIKYGDASNVAGKRGLVLSKLDVGTKQAESDTASFNKIGEGLEDGESDDVNHDRAATEIETCCLEWRAGSVEPQWIYFQEAKVPDAYGCALNISLSPNVQRTYSVLLSTDYPRRSLAKAACAQVALEQGVLAYIKHGDGLERPIVVPFAAEALPPPKRHALTTLHDFHSSLPQPLPDHIGIKSNGEINAVAWLNNMVQVAKGSRMSVAFQWYTDKKLGLHGCLLRLTRPDAPSQSYVVDALFAKRADAKLAVCLYACSQGLGDYVRRVAAEIEARVTPAMRKRCTEEILPALGQALNRVKHGLRPDFTHDCDLATFGCTLTIDLSSDSDPGTVIKRQWNVPLAYRSKADAKIAVTCLAADDGLMDFVKFRGKTPPALRENPAESEPGDAVELEEGEAAFGDETGKGRNKLKLGTNADDDKTNNRKVKFTGKEREVVPLFETREEARARGRFDAGTAGKKHQQRNFSGKGGNRRLSNSGRAAVRGRFTQSKPDRRYSFGDSEGLIAPYSPFTFAAPHPSGFPPHFHQPYSFAPPAHDSGFPSLIHEHSGHGHLPAEAGPAHGQHSHGSGRAGVNTTTSFAYAPPPSLPPVGPSYRAYHDRDYDHDRSHMYRQELPYSGVGYAPDSAQSNDPQTLPYDYDYPATAGDAHSPPPHYAQEYNHFEGRDITIYNPSSSPQLPPPHKQLSQHHPGTATMFHQSLIPPYVPPCPTPPHTHLSTKPIPRYPRAYARYVNNYSIPDVLPSENSSMQGFPNTPPDDVACDNVLKHAERLRPAGLPVHTQPLPDIQSHTGATDALDNIGSGAEKGAGYIPQSTSNTRGEASQLPSPISAPSPSNQNVDVPAKRERSLDRDDHHLSNNKRARDRPGPSDSGHSNDVSPKECDLMQDKTAPPQGTAAGRDGVKITRCTKEVPMQQKRKGNVQISYVTALFEHCAKEGLPRPELCHEEVVHETIDKADKANNLFKVWVVMGKERLELPTKFRTLIAGQERVAKSVLGRLKLQTKKREDA